MTHSNNKNTETVSSNLDPKDLNWLAFCYIANELNQTEREEFEARLLECESARDAVIGAVRETQILYRTLQQDSQPMAADTGLVSRKTNSSFRWIATFAASAAALLLAVNSWSLFFPSDTPVVVTESDGLAAAWAETLITMSDEELNEFINEEVPQNEVVTDGLDDWMFVALAEADSSENIEGETH